MFLIFSLARPDVLLVGDLGFRAAVRRHYKLAELPKAAESRQISALGALPHRRHVVCVALPGQRPAPSKQVKGE